MPASTIDALFGGLRGGGSEIVSLHFPADQWSSSQAKKWLKAHGFKDNVEPARP